MWFLIPSFVEKLGSSEGKQGNVLFIYSAFDVNLIGSLDDDFWDFNDFGPFSELRDALEK